jgi:hypothetical protein
MVRMKIVLGNKSSHLNSKLNSEIECREFKRLLLDDIILAFTKDEIDAIKKSISTNLTNVQWKSVLFEILNVTPKSKCLTSPPIDTFIADLPTENVFLDLLNYTISTFTARQNRHRSGGRVDSRKQIEWAPKHHESQESLRALTQNSVHTMLTREVLGP